MKTITILFSTLIAQHSTVLAETVYLDNVGVHNVANATPEYVDYTFHRETVILGDRISSVLLQPFVAIYDEQGHSLPQQGFVFLINVLEGDGYRQIIVADATQSMTIQVQNYPYEDTDPSQPVYLNAGFDFADGGSVINFQNITEPQTWYYGFDVLSYETAATVPEPSTFLLLAGGIVAVLLAHFIMNP